MMSYFRRKQEQPAANEQPTANETVVDRAAAKWTQLNQASGSHNHQDEEESLKARPVGAEGAHMEYNRGAMVAKETVTVTQLAPDGVTAKMQSSMVYSDTKNVDVGHAGKSASTRYDGTHLVAEDGEVNFAVRGGASRWITGQTRRNIMVAPRPALVAIWNDYRQNPLNPSVKEIDVQTDDFKDIKELREFICSYLESEQGK